MHLSVIRLTESAASTAQPLIGTLSASTGAQLTGYHGKPYLWAIGGGEYHPPLLSGIAETKREVERIAEQYGIKEALDYSVKGNEYLIEMTRRNWPVASYLKRQSGKYALAVWTNTLDYLIGAEPVAFEDHPSEQALKEAITRWKGCPYAAYGDYIHHYIRRKEAERKFSTPSTSSTAGKIEFVYANHNEGERRRPDWQRHRIIKITDQTIFVDRYPFCGTSYLRSGWRAMVVYANMLDRESMEQELCFYHRDRRMHFYTERRAKRKCRRFFVKGGVFSDDVLELPPDGVGWALKLLEITQWPATVEAIKKAFARSAMKHHPDRGGTHHMFISCMAAREFLLDQIAA